MGDIQLTYRMPSIVTSVQRPLNKGESGKNYNHIGTDAGGLRGDDIAQSQMAPSRNHVEFHNR